MEKNRYNAEETKSDILRVATKLFAEKGYEKTSIQDIVNGLDGLTRGAVYHHFSSKEEILNTSIRRLLPKSDFFDSIAQREDLNGIEKIQAILIEGTTNEEVIEFFDMSRALFHNPMYFVEYMRVNTEEIAPRIKGMLDEANNDGTTQIQYTAQIAEIILLLASTWFVSAVFPNTVETFYEKLAAIKYLFDSIGLPIFDDQLLTTLGINL